MGVSTWQVEVCDAGEPAPGVPRGTRLPGPPAALRPPGAAAPDVSCTTCQWGSRQDVALPAQLTLCSTSWVLNTRCLTWTDAVVGAIFALVCHQEGSKQFPSLSHHSCNRPLCLAIAAGAADGQGGHGAPLLCAGAAAGGRLLRAVSSRPLSRVAPRRPGVMAAARDASLAAGDTTVDLSIPCWQAGPQVHRAGWRPPLQPGTARVSGGKRHSGTSGGVAIIHVAAGSGPRCALRSMVVTNVARPAQLLVCFAFSSSVREGLMFVVLCSAQANFPPSEIERAPVPLPRGSVQLAFSEIDVVKLRRV